MARRQPLEEVADSYARQYKLDQPAAEITTALLALALLDANNDIALDGRDLAGSLQRMIDAYGGLPGLANTVEVDNGGNVISPAAVAFGTKLAIAFQGADLAITSQDPTSNKALYSSINHSGSGTYVRKTPNQCFFSNRFNPTCVSVHNSTGVVIGTLVAPDIILTAEHIGNLTGSTFRFVALDNTVTQRTAINSYNVPGTDIQVVRLDTPCPNTITPAMVLSGPIEQFCRGLPSGWVDQNQNCYIDDIEGVSSGGNPEITVAKSSFPQRVKFYHAGQSGDSGAPSFLLLDSPPSATAVVTPVLIGCRHTSDLVSSGGESWLSNYIPQINAGITLMGSAYQLTTYKKTILPPFSPQPGSVDVIGELFPSGLDFFNWHGVLSLSTGSQIVGLEDSLNDPGLYDADGNPLLQWQENPNRIDIVDTASLFIGDNQVLTGDGLHDFVSGDIFDLVLNDNFASVSDPAECRVNLGLNTGATAPAPMWSRVTTQFNKVGDTVFANIPGLVANVAAGKAYAIRAIVNVSQSGDNPGKLSVFGTATATSFIGVWTTPNADDGTVEIEQVGTFSDDDTEMDFSNNDDQLAIFEGTIVVNAAGTLAIRGAVQGDGQLHVLVGSTLMVQEIP